MAWNRLAAAAQNNLGKLAAGAEKWAVGAAQTVEDFAKSHGVDRDAVVGAAQELKQRAEDTLKLADGLARSHGVRVEDAGQLAMEAAMEVKRRANEAAIMVQSRAADAAAIVKTPGVDVNKLSAEAGARVLSTVDDFKRIAQAAGDTIARAGIHKYSAHVANAVARGREAAQVFESTTLGSALQLAHKVVAVLQYVAASLGRMTSVLSLAVAHPLVTVMVLFIILIPNMGRFLLSLPVYAVRVLAKSFDYPLPDRVSKTLDLYMEILQTVPRSRLFKAALVASVFAVGSKNY